MPRSPTHYDDLRARSARAGGGCAVQRDRRGQRGRDLRRPAGDVPLGARRRAGLRRRARLLGEPLHSARPISYRGGRASRRKPAMGVTVQHDGRRRGVRGDVHLQPGQRRPEHGRDQGELGARDRRRRRRDDARRLPRQQGDGRGGPAHGEREGDRVRARPAGRGTVRVEVAAERRGEPCLGEGHLAALVELARRVERHFGGHQDVEWALARGRAAGRAGRAAGAAGDAVPARPEAVRARRSRSCSAPSRAARDQRARRS